MNQFLRYFLTLAVIYLGLQLLLILLGAFLGPSAHADTLHTVTSHTWQDEYAARTGPDIRWPADVYSDQTAQAGPLSPALLADLIEHAIWQWSERTGVRMTHLGIAPRETGGASGRITVVWTTYAGLRSLGAGASAMAATRKWFYDSGHMAGAVIYLDARWFGSEITALAQYIVTHEIGHALGIQGHTSSAHDVMAPTHTHSRYALTAADVYLAGYGARLCHQEAMRDGSVYIPMAGVWLGAENGKAKVLQDGPDLACDTVTVDGDIVKVWDIRGRHGSLRWAKLIHVGGEFWEVVGVGE